MKLIMTLAMVAAMTTAAAQTDEHPHGIDVNNLDKTATPGTDFYKYAVGGWLKANPLDKQHTQNGAFMDLYEQNNDRINDLIMEYAGKHLPQGTDGQKIGSLYRLYMKYAVTR